MCIRRLSALLTAIAWLAATATLSVWFGAAKAHASCGDYLMMQDHDESFETREIMWDLTRDPGPPIPTVPCRGAGCGQAPQDVMTVPITSDRNHDTQLHLDFLSGDVAGPPHLRHGWLILDADATRRHCRGLFRPPRPRFF